MKNICSSFWFWGIVLVAFVAIIMWDDDFEKGTKTDYVKHSMVMNDVHFSSMDEGFESGRMYADVCRMDNNQSNFEADRVHAMMFRQEDPLWKGRLISNSALKSPFEYKFTGNVRAWNSDNERFQTEEARYFVSRKEARSKGKVKLFKDNMIVTGYGMIYDTVGKEIRLTSNVVIKIWDKDEKMKKADKKREAEGLTGLKTAPPIDDILPASVNNRGGSEAVNKSSASKAPIASSQNAL